MKVRNAILSDATSIETLLAQLGHPIGVDHVKFLRVYQSAINDDNQIILVIEKYDTVVGYVSVRTHSPLYAQQKVAFIDEIVINEENRGIGAGQQLMKSLETILGDQDCVICSLATAGAKGFYEKLGYSGHATYLKRSL